MRDVRVETPRTRVVRLTLDRHDFDFDAGQAVRLGLHGQTERKPYSVACSPEQARETGELEFLVQVGADGSAGTHLGVPAPEMLVDVEGPFGSFRFPDNPPERRFLFVAGGTGIAPLRAMLWHAAARFPGREMAMIYSARSSDEFAYEDELQKLARAGLLNLVQTVTRTATREWTGARGRITDLQIAAMITAPTLCLLCGPPALVENVAVSLAALGVPKDRILAEEWG